MMRKGHRAWLGVLG